MRHARILKRNKQHGAPPQKVALRERRGVEEQIKHQISSTTMYIYIYIYNPPNDTYIHIYTSTYIHIYIHQLKLNNDTAPPQQQTTRTKQTNNKKQFSAGAARCSP